MNNKVLILLLVVILTVSCKKDYEFVLKTQKTIKNEKEITATLVEKNGQAIDSVLYSINGKKATKNNVFQMADARLGKHTIAAIVFYNGKNKKIVNTVIKLAAQKPVDYTYEIIHEYEHDPNAFTQGLEFDGTTLYETTGQYGKSTLRKVNYKTGEVEKASKLEATQFGEGMTIFKDKIHWLTWQAGKGYVYNKETFKREGEFKYGKSVEGWGLTHDDAHIIKSDGSKKIWFLNPEKDKEEFFIEAYTDNLKTSKYISKLNELEYVNGKIYANVWQENYILIINPSNGAIEGVINLKGLQAKAGQRGENNVLNGIAYLKQEDRLFVTGKKWNKLFEIKLVKK